MRDGDIVRRNAYSLMSSPSQSSHYMISVRRDDRGRGGSRYLHNAVQPGAILHISRPVNLFPVAQLARKHLLVAGGIGITPILAMCEQLLRDRLAFELHYANRSRERAAYSGDLVARYGERVHLYHSDEGERIPFGPLLQRQPLGTHLYVCGPARMIDSTMTRAQELGWPSQNLHHERFAAPTIGLPYDVRLARSGRTVRVGFDQSMLEAIEADGVDAPYLCRGGACGQCETGVLVCDGELLHADHFLTADEKASRTKVMLCVSRFSGRSLVLDL
jgi:dimethylamine monooxygenase subunit B